MPTVSGHIGEVIPFEVQNAGTVTGVFYGTGEANYEILNQSFLNARVPDDANWGYVSFRKQDIVAVYAAVGTGYQETGALNNLTSNLTSSGFLGACLSGNVTYSNLYDPITVCALSATGISEYLASGKLYHAFSSGFCGDDIQEYTNGGYSTNTTKLSDFNTFKHDKEWLAIGNVVDTGNAVYKKSETEVTCSTPNEEMTH